jgi:hypothetical protein
MEFSGYFDFWFKTFDEGMSLLAVPAHNEKILRPWRKIFSR